MDWLATCEQVICTGKVVSETVAGVPPPPVPLNLSVMRSGSDELELARVVGPGLRCWQHRRRWSRCRTGCP